MNLIFSTLAEGLVEYVRRSTAATGLVATTPSNDAVHAAYFQRNGKFYRQDFYGLPKHYSGIWNEGMGGARREEHAEKSSDGMGGATREEHGNKITPSLGIVAKKERLTASSLGEDGTPVYDLHGKAVQWQVEPAQGERKGWKIRSPGGHTSAYLTRRMPHSKRLRYTIQSAGAEVTRREALA